MTHPVACGRSGRRRRLAILLPAIALALTARAGPGAAAERYQADTWRAECEGAAPGTGCSIIGTFRSYRNDGSFALAVDLQSGVLAIVGEPPPLGATLQIDRFPKMHCSGPRYCLFSLEDSAAAARQLLVGSLVLVDVETKNGVLHASLTPIGYRLALAKIMSWHYPVAPAGPANPGAGRRPGPPASGPTPSPAAR